MFCLCSFQFHLKYRIIISYFYLCLLSTQLEVALRIDIICEMEIQRKKKKHKKIENGNEKKGKQKLGKCLKNIIYQAFKNTFIYKVCSVFVLKQ